MYNAIKSNKVRSYLLVFFFLIFVIAVGYIFGVVLGYGYPLLALVVAIAIGMALFSYFKGDQAVLKLSKAREVKKDEFPLLVNIVEGLSIASGLPKPKTYVIEDSAMNAFATGRDPKHASVAVTTGLLNKLDRTELEGVIAHELSHVKNYDIRLMTLIVILVGTVVLLGDFMFRSFLFGGPRRSRNNQGSGIFILIAIVLAILSPIIAQLIKLAISRKREFLADADGALLTRYPEGLANALEKLSKNTEPLKSANKATAHLFIVNPLKNVKGNLNKLFQTHPPIDERIKRLRGM
ncbi:zinc metalloprotease HtpX [archaeon]|nr:zinc metalloprotease HtpX [archaeon]